LADSPHDIFWYCLKSEKTFSETRPLPEKIHRTKTAEHKTDYRWIDYWRLSKEFTRIIDKIKPGLIHAGPVQTVALLPALSGAHPLVSMSWGFDMLEDARRNCIWRWVTRFVLSRSDWLIADCHTVKKEAQKLGFSGNRVSVFPWGVDLALFRPVDKEKAKETLGFDKRFTIVHTRSWAPRYGVDVMLEGFRRALEAIPDLHLVMLGGGSQADAVKMYRKDNHLENSITLAGYQTNDKLMLYYQAADAYLSASHVDGSSVALLEAMACGTPAIVSDIPSNLEWVINGENGWVFREDDPGALASSLAAAFHAKGNSDRYRMAARQKTEKDADWTKGVDKLLETYEQAAMDGASK